MIIAQMQGQQFENCVDLLQHQLTDSHNEPNFPMRGPGSVGCGPNCRPFHLQGRPNPHGRANRRHGKVLRPDVPIGGCARVVAHEWGLGCKNRSFFHRVCDGLVAKLADFPAGTAGADGFPVRRYLRSR